MDASAAQAAAHALFISLLNSSFSHYEPPLWNSLQGYAQNKDIFRLPFFCWIDSVQTSFLSINEVLLGCFGMIRRYNVASEKYAINSAANTWNPFSAIHYIKLLVFQSRQHVSLFVVNAKRGGLS